MSARQTGFTLIEVLIAIVVLSIGLLGLAALQATGLRSGYSASLRSQATLLAYEMTDRMRANKAGYEAGHYNDPTPADHDCVWDGSAPSICSAAQMAGQDAYEWEASIARELTQGVGVVCLDSTPDDGGDADGDHLVEDTEYACDNTGSLYAVKVWWVDELGVDTSGSPEPIIQGFATGFQP